MARGQRHEIAPGHRVGGGQEPWVSDGTPKGTHQLAEIAPGIVSSWPAGFSGIGDHVVFRAFSPSLGYEPYLTDGTRAGTRLLKDISPGVAHSFGGAGVMMEGKLYFTAQEPSTGSELWVTDFTTAGTRIAVDLVPGKGSSKPWILGARNGRVYLVATAASMGNSLWATDGSATGTRLFMTHQGRPNIWEPKICLGSRRVTFTIQDAKHGYEPAVTDGTASGTRLLEIVPGATAGLLPRSNSYVEWIVLGSRLLIPGHHPLYGNEIFVVAPKANRAGVLASNGGTSTVGTW